MNTKLEISWRSLWKIFFMSALVWAIILAHSALIVLFIAIIISSAFDGVVSYLQKRKIPRVLGTIFVFLAVLSVFILTLYAIVPVVVSEFQNFVENFSIVKLPVIGYVDLSGLVGIEQYANNMVNFIIMLFNGGGSFINFATGFIGNLTLIIMTFVISLYLTIDKYGVENFLRTILPIDYEDQVLKIYLRVRKQLGFWFQGEIILILLIGALTFFGLWLLGVKYALLIGVLTALLEIIPVAGPIIAGAVAFVVTLPQSLALALYTLLVFIIIHQIESNILVPLVMKRAVGISPVVVVFALLAGAQIAGLIGAILAVPIAVVFQEIIFDWERKKTRTGRLGMNDE